jgi:hypothetical protein
LHTRNLSNSPNEEELVHPCLHTQCNHLLCMHYYAASTSTTW